MTPLTKDFLIRHGWRDAFPNVVKDFKDWKGDKYRIGWNYETCILYVGYGQLPFCVLTVEHLVRILDVLGYSEYADSLLNKNTP